MQNCFMESVIILILAFQLQLSSGEKVKRTVVGSAQPVVGVWSQSITLPCHISPPVFAVKMEVRWYRDRFAKPVHLYKYGRDDQHIQDRDYRERTQLLKDQLSTGNVSLRLTDIRLSDRGVYHCFVDGGGWHNQGQTELIVTALGAQPSVSLDRTGQSRLLFRSEGWYPEPEVTWRDRNGRDVTSLSSTVVPRDSQGLFTVNSHVNISQESNEFSCLVRGGIAGPDWGSRLHISEDFYPAVSGWLVLFSLTVALSITAIPLLVIGWRKLSEIYNTASNRVTDCRQKELVSLRRAINSEWSWMRSSADDVTLDSDTANPRLILSEDGKQVTRGERWQRLPVRPERFDRYVYVLGRDGFTAGRHYWEVQVGEKKERWFVGVARESVDRKGVSIVSPDEGYWVLYLYNEEELSGGGDLLPLSLWPQKVGVYVDYEGGQVSFYNADTRSHIHTVTDTFTERLYPVFCPGASADDLPLVICPV
ncbi:BT1A1 protein, partial [Amia calva]|nr:BT1A1 protein [Amia calva]